MGVLRCIIAKKAKKQCNHAKTLFEQNFEIDQTESDLDITLIVMDKLMNFT